MMIMRKLTFILAAVIFLVACYTLYSSLDATTIKKKAFYERGRKDISELENRLKQLQDELARNEQMIGEIRNKMNNVIDGGVELSARSPIKSVDELKVYASENTISLNTNLVTPSVQFNSEVCAFSSKQAASSDVQMLDVYDLLTFENPDGGVWKQGWDISYDKTAIEKKPKLQIYVVPHSHTDPGWIKTFEKYYQDQTKLILDNMASKLSSEKRMKFIYAEISFFERWWRDIDDIKRNAVRKLIENGQFEIVTGAWVMTDEANAHYYSMIDQMIEGNQWLENHLNYKPKNHWSIDPFGLSSTMAYLTKLSNFTSMTVQRVHYAIKKAFARGKQLEFVWRQLWNSDETSDIFCHIFPFYSYDIPHTCGPDPKVCCQFDFRRLSGSGIGCPWHVPPVPISETNVEERASTLLDQYRKHAELYRSNVLLIPLGDDFRYDTDQEWNQQFDNYNRMFTYMNSKKEWNVQAQFGTLNDYYQALYKETETEVGKKPKNFPVLTGDFFTYADRDDHYWSGYYTTRPFYKRMDRVLQYYLRGAELAYSVSLGYVNRDKIVGYPFERLFPLLVNSRRNLGLFQHHDGITGTAKDHVVVDYGQRLLQSIHDCRSIISISLQLMLTSEKKKFQQDVDSSLPFEFNERIANHDSVPEKVVIAVASNHRSLVVYNSLSFARQEIVCINVASTNVDVVESSGNVVKDVQINPVIFKDRDRMEVSNTVFEICWLANVPPLGVVRFTVKDGISSTPRQMSTVTANFPSSNNNFKTKKFDSEFFTLRTSFYEATFDSKSGFLNKLKIEGDAEERLAEISFAKYGTTSKKDKSGAYLFLPDGEAIELPKDDNRVLFVEGPLFSVAHVIFAQVKHTVKMCHLKSLDCQHIDVSNLIDITQESNYELVMRVKTDVKNTDRTFFTDLNGLQIVKRKYFEKIPLQGNVYPMSTSAFIEDSQSRFTALTAQPLGVGSVSVGGLEVFLDRRLMQDDNRGLFQSINDNKVTPNHFRFVFEKRRHNSLPTQKAAYHTLTSHLTSLTLLHPFFVLYNKAAEPSSVFLGDVSTLSKSLPCDVHLINFRTLEAAQEYASSPSAATYPNVKPKNQHALLLHRVGVDCSAKTAPTVSCNMSTDGTVALNDMFRDFGVESLEETSLTLMYSKYEFKSSLPFSISIKPMDIKTFKMRLKST